MIVAIIIIIDNFLKSKTIKKKLFTYGPNS